MELVYQEIPGWPPLAWLARFSSGSDKLEVLHGSHVETHSTWFGEILWNDKFINADFHLADLVYGSGCRIENTEAVFVSSSTTTDRLQYYLNDDNYWISNSLPCLLQQTGADLDPFSVEYAKTFKSIIKGIDHYERCLTTSAGLIWLTYYRNLKWDGSELSEIPKAFHKLELNSFDDYKGYLEDSLQLLAENMRSTDRRQQYDFLGTISAGFDSPTVSALARSAGLNHVITFTKARQDKDDSGQQIAELLGLDVCTYDRDYWSQQAFSEIPFIAADAKGEDVYFSAASNQLAGKVLLTGYAAGAWSLRKQDDQSLRRADQSGLAHTEFRLWSGYIHLPVPTIGNALTDQICQIMHSADMANWRSGKSYDKPFCRRYLVEAGVSAKLFGQDKKAASVLFFDRSSFLSEHSYQDYQDYLREQSKHSGSKQFWRAIRDLTITSRSALLSAVQEMAAVSSRVAPLKTLKKVANSVRLSELASWTPEYDYLFPWAINHAKQKYNFD